MRSNAAERRGPEVVLLSVPAEGEAQLEDRVGARISTWACATVSSPRRLALKVTQPANMCPCGVISVNDSSSE